MKRRLLNFLAGRNGPDALSNTITVTSLILMLVSAFCSHSVVGIVLYTLSISGMIYGYFRIFSRNLVKRQRENFAFLEFFKVQKLKRKERKTHRYFRCPKCRAYVRVPKGRGAITITCRKCGKRFDKKS